MIGLNVTLYNTGISLDRKVVEVVKDTYENTPVCKVQKVLSILKMDTHYVTMTLNQKAAEVLEVVSSDCRITPAGKKIPLRLASFITAFKSNTPAIRLNNSSERVWLVEDLEEGEIYEYSFTLKACQLTDRITTLSSFASFEKRGVDSEYFELKPEVIGKNIFWLFEPIEA